MRFLAISHLTAEATAARLQATMNEEISVGERLYAQGVIREAYTDPSYRRAILIVEAASLDAIRTAFAAYPQIREGLIEFEFIPLVGLPAVAMVHAANGTPLPAWWPDAARNASAAAGG